jgi:hypothetical protein
MSESVIVAIITGVISLVGTVLTVWASSTKTQNQLKIQQAVTDQKIENLTQEVRDHNNFARRMPVVEEQIKVINHQLEDIERRQGG